VNLGNSVTDKSGSTLERRITPKMADIPVPGYHAFWTDACEKLKSEYQQLIGQFPGTDATTERAVKSNLRHRGNGKIHSSLGG
jgi:hypothetical protein